MAYDAVLDPNARDHIILRIITFNMKIEEVDRVPPLVQIVVKVSSMTLDKCHHTYPKITSLFFFEEEKFAK